MLLKGLDMSAMMEPGADAERYQPVEPFSGAEGGFDDILLSIIRGDEPPALKKTNFLKGDGYGE